MEQWALLGRRRGETPPVPTAITLIIQCVFEGAVWLFTGAARRHEVPFQSAGKERSVQKPYSSDRNVRMHHRRGRA